MKENDLTPKLSTEELKKINIFSFKLVSKSPRKNDIVLGKKKVKKTKSDNIIQVDRKNNNPNTIKMVNKVELPKYSTRKQEIKNEEDLRIIKSGYLLKKNEDNKEWKERWLICLF